MDTKSQGTGGQGSYFLHLFLEGGRDLTPTYRCEIPPSLKEWVSINIFSSLDGCSCTITLGKFFEGALQKERI